MEKKHDLLIIIPAHNEEKNLPRLLERMRADGIDALADVLVIDDASTDGTAEAARRGGAGCISLICNLGYGNALQTGYRFAYTKGYDYLIQMDADLQHDPCNIAVIYDRLKTPCEDGIMPDIVLGSRFMKGSGEYRPGVLKKLGFRWFRFLFRLLGGGELADATTGLQGLSRRAFGHYVGFDNFDAKYPDANMILEMKLLDYRVLQVPAVMHTRADGKGMHAGIWNPIKYAVRSTIAVVIARMRVRARK
jgi:glycosyltransferase involved in cell wall biosynthesis